MFGSVCTPLSIASTLRSGGVILTEGDLVLSEAGVIIISMCGGLPSPVYPSMVAL